MTVGEGGTLSSQPCHIWTRYAMAFFVANLINELRKRGCYAAHKESNLKQGKPMQTILNTLNPDDYEIHFGHYGTPDAGINLVRYILQ